MSSPASEPREPAAVTRPERKSLKARTADLSSAEAAALERERWMRRIQKVKDRNEADHQRALRDQREQLNRVHDAQLRRMRRDHEDDLRRVRLEARSHEDQLRAQLSEVRRLTSHPDPGRLTSELTKLREEKRQLEKQLQAVVESDRRNGDLVRQTDDVCENELRANEKQTKNKVCEQKSGDDGALSPGHTEQDEQAVRAEEAQREAQLQRQVRELQAAVKALLRNHSRKRRQWEKKIKRMESELKPSRIRAKRTVARLLQARSRDARAVEKSAIPGETKLPKPVARAGPRESVKRRKASAPPADSAEVIQLKRKVEELQKCIAQLRETTQNKTNRLGLVHAQRPHRLLQGKMSDLPTLPEDERYDSLEDTAAEERGSDVSDIKPSDLAELSREELRQLCCQLQRAHQQLRQAHELMLTRVRETSRSGRVRSRVENELLASQSLVRDLEAALATKGVDPSALQEKSVLTAQNLCLTQKLRDLRAREVKVKHELQELRDLNELMEFRILELEGCQEKSADRTSPVPPSDQSRPNSVQQQAEHVPSDAQTLEAAGEDRRSSAAPAAIEAAPAPAQPPPEQQQQQQLASLSEERHQWQQKIAELQNTILQLEASLEEAASQQLVPATEAKLPSSPPPPLASPPPPPLTSGHQRQPSGNSESELSDYHSDSNDGRPARRSPAGGCLCGGRLPRQLTSPDHPPLQESGIFDVDVDEKAVQTEVQESEVSMRELIDLTSEIARLTSVQEQLERSPLPIVSRIRHADSERAEEVCERVSEVEESPAARTALVCAEVQTDYVHDQLLCDYKEMCERYEKVKKTYDVVQDEKNELEEAENDARLMVQRLEMKIFASNEVEKMLSSDLADEQERCRQLQRQLNSVKLKHQADIKARQADQPGRAQMTERVQQLERQVEELTERLRQAGQRAPAEDRGQQTEAAAGAWEVWRATEVSSTDTLSSAETAESANGSSADVTSPGGVTNTESLTRRLDQAWSFNDSGVGEELSRISAPEGEVAPSPQVAPPAQVEPPVSRPAKRPRTEAEPEEADSASLASDVTMCNECNKRLGDTETLTSPKNSLDSNLSERESYYSECIQELETQKSELRKRWEDEKSAMLKQVEETCQESSELKNKMEEILRDGEAAKESLSKKVAQLKLELREQAKSSEKDRNELIKSHNMKAQSLQEQQVLLKRRMRAAEDVLNALKVEFDLCQMDSGRESPDPSYALVLDRVRHLHQSQKELASQVSELEKKEGAYRETLQEADKIMHNVEIRYQKKIEELENQLREDKNKISLMEETENKLKQALKSVSNGKHDKDRVTELLDKLIETENEDLKLKEKVYRLERRERELSIRLREEERAAEGLRHELRDQEELLRELDTARRELSAATEQLSVLPGLRQRTAELQQSEEFLRGRIEELEQAELGLQETLRNTRTAQAHKERRSADQVSSLQQDVESLQASVQELQLAAAESGEERSRLRRELQEARRQLQEVHRDLEATNGTATETENQFRNEVCKLRNQLSLVNSQLNDNDSYSCQLRDQLEKTQSENVELRAALDGCKSRSEQDVLQLNLEISRREEEITALSEQLAELDKSQLAGELDLLAEQENTLVKLLSLAKQSNDKIQNCEQCTSEVDGALRSVIQELEQLTLLLSGSHTDQSLQSQLRDAENLASAATLACSTEEPHPVCPSVAVQTDQTTDQELSCCAELRQELAAKEQELGLMDGQGSYLQAELEQRDREARQLRARLGETDSLLEHQRLQHGRLSELLAQAQFARDEAAARAEGKDALLGAVLRHLRTVLEAHQAAALVRGLRETADEDADRQDLDREMVCQILQQIVTVMRERVLRSRSSRNSSPDQAGAGSRIPRPVPRSRENTPPSSPRKDLPRSKAPVPRCLQPKRGPRQVPPVGVARPYRSTPSTTDTARDRVLHPRPAPHKAPAPAPALPPPDNFQIIRAVGGDSLLLYWSPSDDQRITGYEIFANNRLQQVIRNPQRTKALLPSLRLSSQLQLAIRAVGVLDSFSALSWAEYRPGQLAGSRPRAPPAPHPVTTHT